MLAVCDGAGGCGKRFDVQGFKTDKMGRGIHKVYFTCPRCGKEYLCYYTDPHIRDLQHKIRQARLRGRRDVTLQAENKIAMNQLKAKMQGTQ